MTLPMNCEVNLSRSEKMREDRNHKEGTSEVHLQETAIYFELFNSRIPYDRHLKSRFWMESACQRIRRLVIDSQSVCWMISTR